MRICLLLLCFSSLGALQPEEISKRVQAHLLIQDPASACAEAQEGFEKAPHSPLLFEAYVKALAKHGDEKQLWQVWNARSADFPEVCQKREVLESIAWGILEKGARSPAPLIRVMALLGAYISQDARGVELLWQNMRDPNSKIRAVTIQLAGHMRDVKLQDGVLHAFDTDSDWKVRLAAIEAMGLMEIPQAKPRLLKLLANPQATAEEKGAAIEALVASLEDAQREEIEQLVQSNRAGLRELACAVVLALGLERDTDLMIRLLADHHADVRAAALRTLGVLRIKSHQEKPLSLYVDPYLQDGDPLVALTAAWVTTLNDPAAGRKHFPAG